MIIENKKEELPDIFKIDVNDLKNEGIRQINCELPGKWIAGELKNCEYATKPVQAQVDLTVQAPDNGVLITGKVNVQVSAQCATCLENVVLDINADINAFLLPVSQCEAQNDKEELTPEDLSREWYDGDEITLDSLIKDSILLELPMNPRCHGSCKKIEGLVLAKDELKEKIDPRLAPLANIKLSKE